VLAKPDCTIFAFLLAPAPGLLERHAQHRTALAALLAEILGPAGGKEARHTTGQ
jgi:hypothetical protein